MPQQNQMQNFHLTRSQEEHSASQDHGSSIELLRELKITWEDGPVVYTTLKDLHLRLYQCSKQLTTLIMDQHQYTPNR